MNRVLTRLLSLVACAWLLALPALAQTPFRHSGVESKHATFSPLPNEHIDPASGSLSLVATDLALPGNAGFDLRITRVYTSGVFSNYDPSGNTAIDEDSWAGIGWRLHFGRVLNPNATTGGATVVEMGDGSRQPLQTTTAHPEGWITPGFGRYDRTTHTLKLPNGYIYVFDRVVDLGGTLGVVRYVTEIRDAFQNKIELSYVASPGPLDGVSQIRQYLSATQVRYVNFTYDGAQNTLRTMEYGGRTWTYTHAAEGSAGLSTLRAVQPPLGPPELYDYAALPGELTRWETSAGGVTTYTYQDAYRKASTLTTRTRVVTGRVVSGRLVTPGTWTFQYGTGANEDTTVIACACGTTRYRFLGTGLTGDFSGWMSGALHEQTVEEAGGTVLERRTFTWVRSEAISPDPVSGVNGVWADPAVYAALLASTTVTRGSQSWTTSHEYHTANYNDYGQPWKVTESGEFTRTTTRTFQSGFTPYIVGLPSQVQTAVGAQSSVSNWTYDLSTGFPTSFVGPRAPLQTFVPRADGNVASAKDALNHETFFENYTWGLATRIRTPKLTTDLTVNDDGAVVSASTGAVTVSYTYDALFRPKTISSYGVNPVVHEYDNVNNTSAWVSRGSVQVTSLIDGFGRLVRTTHSSGVKARTEYDACGRAVFASMPYTTGEGTAGSTTEYDALGRVKRVTAPNSAVTQYAYTGIDVTVTDAAGRATLYDYSAAGSPGAARLISVRDANNQTTTYTYDTLDTLVKVSGLGATPDRVWAYDTAGYLVSDTQPEGGTTQYAYDAARNVTQITDAKGQVIAAQYDENNRLRLWDGPGTADDVTLTYDVTGRLTAQSRSGASTALGYNAAGQLASRTDVFGALTFVSRYEYDLNENLTKIIYPSGRVVTYEYDTQGRLTTVKQNGAVFADTFTYDGAGRLASYRTGTVTHTVTYDTAGRTSRLTSGGALDLNYSYDPVGNVTAVTEPVQPAQAFSYDNLNRLTGASGAWGQRSWAYNAAGDRTAEFGPGATSYQYDATTRRLLSTTGTRSETFLYDAIGQMVQDGRGTYTYNASGLVTQFAGPEVTATYDYDPSGLRVARTVNEVTTYTVRSSGGAVLSEYRGACGTPVWTRDVLYAGGRLLGSIKATGADPTIALTSSTGTVTEASTTVTITIALTTPGGTSLRCPVTVSYATVAGTAAAGVDYRTAGGSVTFAAGAPSGATRTLTIDILPDAIDEDDETFTVTVSGATGARLSGAAAQVITITDDDAPPGIVLSDASVLETDTGTAVLTVSMALDAPSAKTVTVTFATADMTATAPADYASASGQVTFDPGTTSRTVGITVVGDVLRELDEHVRVTLTAPVNVSLVRGLATGTIRDNDRPSIPPSSDFNGDGKPDLLWQHEGDGSLTVWLMDGLTRLSEVVPTPGQVPDTTWKIVGTADVDADGDADIFWQNTTSGDLSVWTMNGMVQVSGQSLVPNNAGDANWRVRAVADINGDGTPDLLWQHLTQGWVAVWTMNGLTRIEGHLLSPTAVSASWQIVGTGDLNQDGITDLVWHHDTTGELAWWRLDGVAQVSGGPLSPGAVTDTSWTVRGAADLDLDGQTDLLWQRVTTGELSGWLLNGTTLRSGEALTPAQIGLGWRMVGPR